MKHLSGGISIILSRKDSRAIIIVTTLIFLLFLLLAMNGEEASAVFGFDALPYTERLWLSARTLLDVSSAFTANAIILATLGALLGGINMSLAYTYMRLRGELLLHSGVYSGAGLLLAFLGVGCVACGTAFLSVLLSFLGFSAMLHALPYHGAEIGYMGLIILSMATYYLAKKVSTPGVC